MESTTPPPSLQDDSPLEGAEALLATALQPLPLPPQADAALGARLFARVARSAQAARAFHTVRRDDGDWQPLAEGVRARLLDRTDGCHSALIEFAPGAQLLATSDRRLVRECLVLRGDLAIGGLHMGAQDYHLSGLDAPRAQAASAGGALVYLRSSLYGSGGFGDVAASSTVTRGGGSWQALRPGVQIKPLFTLGERISMLARFEPAARVPGHPHDCHEECLMVEGELFLGDVLLREGEFQSAPPGSAHEDLVSDAGCLLFFHGAVDESTRA